MDYAKHALESATQFCTLARHVAGQTGAPSRGRNDETLSNNIRKSPTSFGDEDDDGDGPSAGGAFAVLAALSIAAEDDDEWITVSAKTKKKAPAPAPASAAHGQPRRPAVPPAHAAAIPSKPFSPPSGAVRMTPRTSTGQPRAPYIVPQAPSPRPQTHDLEGRPVSDTYYQTFQKVGKSFPVVHKMGVVPQEGRLALCLPSPHAW